MDTMLGVLNGLLPLGYLLALLGYVVVFVREDSRIGPAVTAGTWALVAVHGAYLVLSGLIYGHVPIANTWESLTFIAFALALVYLVLEWQMGDRATGAFLIATALLLQILSTAFITHVREVPAILRSPMFGIHVTTAMLGYVALAVSAIYGVLYLLQYRQLKRKHVGLLFARLPNLETLSRLNARALALGWLGLTVAIVAGSVWALTLARSGQLDVNLLVDPKFLLTVALWAVYGLCLLGLYVLRWPNSTLASVSVVTFALMVVSSLLVTLGFSSFHRFS
jgi:ABC-type transport system involved in cytochrome c biogenesis permease subunit